MGSDYAACCAQVIPTEKLREFLPEEYADFEAVVRECRDQLDFDLDLYAGSSLRDQPAFACACGSTDYPGEVESLYHKFSDTFDRLAKAFHDKTTVDGAGLVLGFHFHDRENEGSRYDEVRGLFWTVDGMTQPTPAARAWEEPLGIQEAFYVTYG